MLYIIAAVIIFMVICMAVFVRIMSSGWVVEEPEEIKLIEASRLAHQLMAVGLPLYPAVLEAATKFGVDPDALDALVRRTTPKEKKP